MAAMQSQLAAVLGRFGMAVPPFTQPFAQPSTPPFMQPAIQPFLQPATQQPTQPPQQQKQLVTGKPQSKEKKQLRIKKKKYSTSPIVIPPHVTSEAVQLKQQKRQKSGSSKTTDLKKIRSEMKRKRDSIKFERGKQVKRKTKIKCTFFLFYHFSGTFISMVP